MENKNWPDSIRLEMIDRSEFYDNPLLYQYGYYDGYQRAYSTLQSTNALLLEVLRKVANWELPETGRFWDERNPVDKMSYEAVNGTNGSRDYFKNLARKAITAAEQNSTD